MSDKKILVGDMSRETAIGILKLMLEAMEVYDSIAPTPQRRNAVQMAISSLETDEAYDLEYEQPKFCKDCISREEVLNLFNKSDDYRWETTLIKKKIEKIPPVTPQNPTSKNDLAVDCVTRQDVERYIEGFINEHTPKEELEFINLELDGLKHLPSITPIRPKGHWIQVYQGDEIIDYRCSECEFGNTFGKGTIGMNFCPRCGSDNREVEK